MLNGTNTVIVETVIKNLVARNISFTSFDVTKLIGPESMIDHRDVRRYCRTLIQEGFYTDNGYVMTHTSIGIPSGYTVNVYHPRNVPVSDYDKNYIKPNVFHTHNQETEEYDEE